MELYDQHLHSHHSFDSQADPIASVERAIEIGLAGLTFTEHFDTHPMDWEGCIYDDEAYSATIKMLRSQFGQQIFVGKGIEVCFQPDRMVFIRDFLDQHEFDVVLLSVHYFGGHPVYKTDAWKGIETATGIERYLEEVLDAARHCEKLNRSGQRVFDVLAHMDFVKRYTQRFFGTHDMSPFGDLFDEIFRTCVAADLVPEINTSTLRQGLGEAMPNQDAVRRYAAAGGVAMSLGSDAHQSQDVGAGFDQAVSMLKEVGIQKTVVFRNRERVEVAIK